MVSFHDNIVSHLDSSISDTDTSLTAAYDFSSYDIPNEGWLTIGGVADRRPATDGSPPTAEVVKYTSYSFGTGTTTFSGLSRGVDNTTAQSWGADTTVGISITGDLLDYVANYTYATSFGSGDLSSGVLTVNHNMGIAHPNIVVYDASSPQVEVIPDEIRYVDVDTAEVDLSAFSLPSSGWEVRVV